MQFSFQECETSQSDQTVLEQNEEAATEGEITTRSPEAPPPKRRVKDSKSISSAATQQNQAMLVEAFDILKSSAAASTDPYFSYGQHIANELRKYDPRTLAQVKHAINNVIFDADMGKYSYNYAVEGTPISVVPHDSASNYIPENSENNELSSLTNYVPQNNEHTSATNYVLSNNENASML